MTPGDKRERARHIRQIAKGIDPAGAQTLCLIASELEAEAAAEDAASAEGPEAEPSALDVAQPRPQSE